MFVFFSQAGQNLFTLLFTEWVMHKIFLFLFPLIKWLKAKVTKKEFKKSSFDITLKMIGLLYFQQICLVTIPFFPLAGCLMSLFLFANFKLEKLVLYLFYQKPKSAWSGKDSSAFFLRLFLASVFISLSIMHKFLAGETYPKLCTNQDTDMQKKTFFIDHACVQQQYHLQFFKNVTEAAGNRWKTACKGDLVLGGVDEASLDTWWNDIYTNRTDWYEEINKTIAPQGQNCPNKDAPQEDNVEAMRYCACSRACGPFVNVTNGYEPIEALIQRNAISKELYDAFIASPFASWMVALLIFMRYLFKKNSFEVEQDFSEEKDFQFKDIIGNLNRRNMQLQKKVNRLQMLVD